jgi:SAM-dependent methyltransferase
MSETGRERRAENYLQRDDIHDRWSAGYRTAENAAFYDMAFRTLADAYFPTAATVVDVGCGTGAHTARLRELGFDVIGVDLSVVALRKGAAALADEGGPARRVWFVAGSVRELPLRTESCGVVVAWGILMHVPDVRAAWMELGRILRPGGILVVSEANRASVQSHAFGVLRRMFRRRSPAPLRAAHGDEFWVDGSDGTLVTREADIPAAIRMAGAAGLRLMERRAGQLTEAYTRLPSPASRRIVHALNRLWFRHVRLAGPAFGNLLIFRRVDDDSPGSGVGPS